MAYTNPNFTNDQTPPLNADNMNALANAVQLLPVANGGTGKTTFPSGYVLTGNGTGAISAVNVLPVAHGGTGQSSIASLKTSLDLGFSKLYKQSSAPSDTSGIWFNTSNYTLNIYYNSAWVAIRGVFS